MTVREIIGCGLIAGIKVNDARRMTPGFVMDMYATRARYDAKMSGLRKKREFIRGTEI